MNLKYEKYENIAENYIYKNIEAKYNADTIGEKLQKEQLKTLICLHYLLQDIDRSNTGIYIWLTLIFSVLCFILYKIF